MIWIDIVDRCDLSRFSLGSTCQSRFHHPSSLRTMWRRKEPEAHIMLTADLFLKFPLYLTLVDLCQQSHLFYCFLDLGGYRSPSAHAPSKSKLLGAGSSSIPKETELSISVDEARRTDGTMAVLDQTPLDTTVDVTLTERWKGGERFVSASFPHTPVVVLDAQFFMLRNGCDGARCGTSQFQVAGSESLKMNRSTFCPHYHRYNGLAT